MLEVTIFEIQDVREEILFSLPYVYLFPALQEGSISEEPEHWSEKGGERVISSEEFLVEPVVGIIHEIEEPVVEEL
jgi:hypothetical protein